MVYHTTLQFPCKDCEDREMGCHCKCSKYKFFRIAQDVINKRENAAKVIDNTIFSITKHARGVDGVTSRRL